ncbi:transposase [Flavobacterium sp.]|uniref:transposase n=1 Tax=Flavobacterium sp. TaxID=239 RepID=UPI00374D8250
MTLFKDKFKIDSKRLKNWDYAGEAVYFITMVTKNRECIFGSVLDDKMILNENGQIVENELLKYIKIRKNWFFYNWIVMPNHIHLLIEIQEPRIIDAKNRHLHIVEAHSSASPSSISTKIVAKNNEIPDVQIFGETRCCAPLRNRQENNFDENFGQNRDHNFNQNHKNDQNQLESQLSRKPNSISSFVALFKSVTTRQINGSVSIWQPNYHDHIVRNYKRFETIYNYIKTNPSSWETDSMKL